MDFSPARLRGHREGLGLTLHDVAQRIPLGDEVYGQIELGDREVTGVLAHRLAQALNLPVHDLYATGDRSYADEYLDALESHSAPEDDS